jgi:CheY-like chemotaxis protein
MTSLIGDLLDVSRVTWGKVELDAVELDIEDVIADAIEQVRPLVERHGTSWSSNPAPARRGLGDRKRLVQVLTNLLSNAAKYTPDGGRIDVRLETRDDSLTLDIRDTGIGMTPELIEHAFDLFSQGTRGLDRSQGGLGIGLALVKNLLQLHGGTIAVSSDGPGMGSSFRLTLPRIARATLAGTGHGHGSQQGQARTLRIGIVDDNVDAATMLALLLETAGHTVTIAHTAGAALVALPAFAPDVCLLDIGLPDMNGFELARALRAEPRTRQATLVAVTGYAQDKDRHEALAAGFDELLAKPVDLNTLTGVLAAIAARL